MKPQTDTKKPTAEAPKSPDVKRVSTGLIVKRGGLQVLLGVSMLVLTWSGLQIAGSRDHPVTDTIAVSACAFLWLAVYAAATWRAFGTPYLLTSAYVLAMMAFNFGLIAQDGFGIISVPSYERNSGTGQRWPGGSRIWLWRCIGVGFATGCLTSGRRRSD